MNGTADKIPICLTYSSTRKIPGFIGAEKPSHHHHHHHHQVYFRLLGPYHSLYIKTQNTDILYKNMREKKIKIINNKKGINEIK